MNEVHNVENLRFNDGKLVLDIDGIERSFLLRDISLALDNAAKEERMRFEVAPSGYGIHWPLLDEDISIDGLLGVVHQKAEMEIAVP